MLQHEKPFGNLKDYFKFYYCHCIIIIIMLQHNHFWKKEFMFMLMFLCKIKTILFIMFNQNGGREMIKEWKWGEKQVDNNN